NQRKMDNDKKIVDAEGIVFDKAEQAAQIEDEKKFNG
ncbi:MAG: hypothetical protein ACI9RZ_001976, partial [Sphingobacteriales bacterium]